MLISLGANGRTLKWSFMTGGRLLEVVARAGLTVFNIYLHCKWWEMTPKSFNIIVVWGRIFPAFFYSYVIGLNIFVNTSYRQSIQWQFSLCFLYKNCIKFPMNSDLSRYQIIPRIYKIILTRIS